MSHEEATTAIEGLAALAWRFVPDAHVAHLPLTNDPNDDYLAHAALQADAFLVTRNDAAGFGQIDDLRVGRPGTALRLLGALDETADE